MMWRHRVYREPVLNYPTDPNQFPSRTPRSTCKRTNTSGTSSLGTDEKPNVYLLSSSGCVSSNYLRTLIVPFSGHFGPLRSGYAPLKRPHDVAACIVVEKMYVP